MRFNLETVSKGRNLELIGWNDGYVLAQFRGRTAQYVFGPAIPEAEFRKVLSNPFPDRIFTANIKNRYQCHKIAA